jgi:phosphohistidine phosphatase
MQIYLLRHAIAEDAHPGQPDSERALTEEGREKLRRVLKRARQAGVAPGVIFSSPYRRALETASIAAEVLEYNGRVVETHALVPDAAPAEVWEEIRARRQESAILLASHEPLMSTLAVFLLSSPSLQIDMKKAALARIECAQIRREPRGVFKWMITPALA